MRIRGHDAIDEETTKVRTRLKELEVERIELEAKLREWERPAPPASRSATEAPRTGVVEGITATSSAADKVTLFRGLFAGRTDVFPVRWQNKKTGKSGYAPACANEWVRGVCNKPNIRCGECPNQAFIPVSDEIVERRLRGGGGGRSAGDDFVAGVYPMLPDETCGFLAIDFDKENWAADALAVIETCMAKAVPAALVRSRSGNGGRSSFTGRSISRRTKRRVSERWPTPDCAFTGSCGA